MDSSIILLNHDQIKLTITRLAKQVLENHDFSEQSVLIGLQSRGVAFAKELLPEIENISKKKVQYGELDITFYRDDYRTRETPLTANETNIDFSLENKKVVLVDDVLFTGRSIRSAMDALLDFGRPKEVEFLTLIDRRFKREFPIQADYIGRSVDSIESERVSVEWHTDNGNVVKLLANKK